MWISILCIIYCAFVVNYSGMFVVLLLIVLYLCLFPLVIDMFSLQFKYLIYLPMLICSLTHQCMQQHILKS